MDFDDNHMVHASLHLPTGREIVLNRLIQSLTYFGMLEGTPSKRWNDMDIQSRLDQARNDPQTLGEPLLIEPDRRDYERIPGDTQFDLDWRRDRSPDRRHIPEWLPPIVCIGIFYSIPAVHDKSYDGSMLTIVWYQEDYGTDLRAEEKLLQVDWDRHAVDFGY